MKILVIEDDLTIRGLACQLLTDEGYTVTTAHHGQAALDRLTEGYTPDCILLDMGMPVMNGWEFADAYRLLPGPHAPIIVFTAMGAGSRAIKGIGAVARVEKPFAIDDLLEVVGHVTGRVAV